MIDQPLGASIIVLDGSSSERTFVFVKHIALVLIYFHAHSTPISVRAHSTFSTFKEILKFDKLTIYNQE